MKIPILFLALALLSGQISGTKPAAHTDSGGYISATITKYDDGDSPANGMTTQIWCYDMETEAASCVYEFETSAQYSLGFYERETGSVYFVQRVSLSQTDYGDQIFVYHPETGDVVQLTDDFFAVNYVIPWNNRLYFAAERKAERATKLGYLDLATGERVFWRDDGDTLVEGITIDPHLNQIFVTAYSLDERNKNVMNQGNGDFVIPEHSVYMVDMDFESTEKIFGENGWIRTVMSNHSNHTIDMICDQAYNAPEIPSTIVTYSLDTKELLSDTWDAPRLVGKDPNYSDTGDVIYGVAVLDGQRGIVQCSFADHSIRLCMETPEASFINNIYVVQ